MSVNRSVSPPCGSVIARHYRDRFRSCRRAWRTPPRSATCAMWRCRMPPTTASSCTSCARFGATAPSKRCTAAWSQPGSRSLPIPVRMPDTGAPGTRSCTLDFKIRVIGRWLRQHGASRTNPATVAVGFSTDEVHSANRKRAQPWETPDYPLLELGLSRRARLRCSASGHPAVVYVIDRYDDPGDDTLVLGGRDRPLPTLEPGPPPLRRGRHRRHRDQSAAVRDPLPRSWRVRATRDRATS